LNNKEVFALSKTTFVFSFIFDPNLAGVGVAAAALLSVLLLAALPVALLAPLARPTGQD